ncbi:unnamed protein product [Ectocarpus sp. CCAP 1310/34]|nr:unnamed protein product [Ectocarpus sp. CCAP 1310/34]
MVPRLFAACLALMLSYAAGFVSPAPRASFPSTTRARGITAVDLLPAGASGGEIATAIPDASSLLLQRVGLADVGGVHANVVGAAAAADGGEGVGSLVSSLLLASAAPGNPSTASGLFGIAALVIALGAGVLVASTVTGKNGLGAFLTQEKGSNPFYQDTMAKFTPKTPDILNKIRLPDLDFVDVYNQPPAPDDYVDLEQDATFDAMANKGAPDADTIATAEALRQKLLMAVQAKDYDLASSLERELAAFMRKNGMGFEGDQ